MSKPLNNYYSLLHLSWPHQYRLHLWTHWSKGKSALNVRAVSPPAEYEATEPQEAIQVESYFGFVKETVDAYFLVEACVAGVLSCIKDVRMLESPLRIRSGSVLVIADNELQQKWKDAKNWSIPKKDGSFMLSREIQSPGCTTPITHRERSKLFTTNALKPGTKLLPNGLAKRTVSMNGSDGKRYRVISYFYPCHVQHLYTDKKSAGLGPLQIPSRQPKCPLDIVVRDWDETDNQLLPSSNYLAPLCLPPSFLPLDVPSMSARSGSCASFQKFPTPESSIPDMKAAESLLQLAYPTTL
ncbi:hypothetical protein BCR33DRAFT_711226 [Rhizoclosmatium globosum]|uniref:Uncharacterized protein n=1 Tax=Rhizoclosmatium globosum TaxID=329046 RepID=A0A1Y2D3L3_9FUNG|nr:hypothetical protein BCR33DRAFT_711226 [Rhizoclosmatium globosum]|eukprot:ORY53888.1 hypothetical protein BCR33DRAFT_711226 [Rhizoclosmatium globosum]